MLEDKKVIFDFSKLFAAANSIANNSGNSFFIKTVDEQLSNLLLSFTEFLEKKNSITLKLLNFQLTNIEATLSIFFYLKKIELLQYRLFQRDVLLFQKLLLNHTGLKSKKTPVTEIKRAVIRN